MALNARSAGERSITLAMFIMASNAAGIIGSQLFQASDAPEYPIGWTVIVVLTSVALVFSIFTLCQYLLLNRHNRGKGECDENGNLKVQIYHL
jgi:hypothetical protein